MDNNNCVSESDMIKIVENAMNDNYNELQKELVGMTIDDICEGLWKFCDDKGFIDCMSIMTTPKDIIVSENNIVRAVYEIKVIFLSKICDILEFNSVVGKTLDTIVITD